MSEKKVNTKPVDYVSLNQLSQDFETRFVPQTKLSAEQAIWSQNSGNSEEPNLSTSTTIVEVPKELPKVIKMNSSLKKLKFYIASFNMVVKERTTATAITVGLIIAALRDELRKLKGKAIVENTVAIHTMDPEMFKVDVEPLAPRLVNNRTVHSDNLSLTQEQAVILREVVKQEKS
nr:hypothetical protein [Tanacetum cinerariifolium]